jgi:hypothetical protein
VIKRPHMLCSTRRPIIFNGIGRLREFTSNGLEHTGYTCHDQDGSGAGVPLPNTYDANRSTSASRNLDTGMPRGLCDLWSAPHRGKLPLSASTFAAAPRTAASNRGPGAGSAIPM